RWLALCEILVGQLLHRGDEGLNRGEVLPGVAIGLALMASRKSIQGRHQQKTENRYHQHHERQVRKIIKAGIEHRKPVFRNHKTKHLVDQPEPEERDPHLHEDALQNVPVDVVTSSWARTASISSSV